MVACGYRAARVLIKRFIRSLDPLQRESDAAFAPARRRNFHPLATLLMPGLIRSGGNVMLSTILIVVLILLLIGALPTWPYSSGWGYYPGGGLGLVLIIVIVLALAGRI
jgi:uncharacterized protein DUF3309